MSRWVYLTYIPLVPILLALLFFTYKKFVSIVGKTLVSRSEPITNTKYTKLELNSISNDLIEYKIPRGQTALFKYKNVSVHFSDKTRVSTGGSVGGIRIPFARVSLQKRKYMSMNEYIFAGLCNLTVTNTQVRLDGIDIPLLRNYKINTIEVVKLIDNRKTVMLSLEIRAWPIKVTFGTKKEAVEFMNAVWTIFNNRPTKENMTEWKNTAIEGASQVGQKTKKTSKKNNKSNEQITDYDWSSDMGDGS